MTSNQHDSDKLIFRFLDGSTDEHEFELLQDALAFDQRLRERFCELMLLEHSLRTEGVPELASVAPGAVKSRWPLRKRRWMIGSAAWVLCVGLLAGMLLWTPVPTGFKQEHFMAEGVETGRPAPESTMTGHATLRRAGRVGWAADSPRYRIGDTVQSGTLAITEGMMQIDFFSGARLFVEGPAHLTIHSDWRVAVIQGRCRVRVPEVARGFVVEAADSEIIDLGTEFVVDVSDRSATLAVLDGEVRVRSVSSGESLLTKGQSHTLAGENFANAADVGDLMTEEAMDRQIQASLHDRYEAWTRWSHAMEDDPRLIAYYPIARFDTPCERIPQVSTFGDASDGIIVGWTPGSASRFQHFGNGLGFSRPGSRLRVHIDGEFPALTLACWVRIDALPQHFSSLMMCDGYEPGEPHWQISQDGRLMISVMAGDEDDAPPASRDEDWVVWREPWHKVYYSPPIWDLCEAGRWMHVATVYDPPSRTVRHYVDGRQVSKHRIADQHLVEPLRFGNAEIGNWGQPYRKTPAFAVRNLHGAVDEVMLFKTALSGEEIEATHRLGSPDAEVGSY